MTEAVVVACITTVGGIMVAGLGIIGSWVRAAKRAAQTTEHEVQPNSGHSMRDAINRIDRRMVSLLERQDRTDRRLEEHLTQAAHESEVIAGLVRHLATHDPPADDDDG